MNEIQTESSYKLFSQKAIALTTFFGGPLAASILIRRNFINLGNETYGKHSLFIGIVSTILLYVGIFSIPESAMEHVPNSIIPAIYTLIIYIVVERFQGKDIKRHKETGSSFFSGWKAAWIGIMFCIIQIAAVVGITYSAFNDFDSEKYDKGIVEFTKNEEAALELYKLVNYEKPYEIEEFIQTTGIPLWEKNLKILNELDKIDGIYSELIEQNSVLKKYCRLRIEAYDLIKKSMTDTLGIYFDSINEKEMQINTIIESLN